MKTFYLSATAFLFLNLNCLAQVLLPLTNDMVINEQAVRFILTTNSANLSNFSNELEMRADQISFWRLHNTSSNLCSVLFPQGHRFSADIETANGVAIPKTDMGKSWSKLPKSPKDPYSGRGVMLSPGEVTGGELTELTNLFKFPSNGVYRLELRCWVWSISKKQFVLSDPVRARVIKHELPAMGEPKS